MAAPCALLGGGITDDTLVNIARFLPVNDRLSLQLWENDEKLGEMRAEGRSGPLPRGADVQYCWAVTIRLLRA